MLLVLNKVMVVALQVPLASFGTITAAARKLLVPLSAAFTLAEMLHARISWELSVTLGHSPSPWPSPRVRSAGPPPAPPSL
ncbi:hypothetical protein ADK57_07090 [Streptomyces sp. MMG1533]|uniref:hypothetical protein n=1 Tax=Streptomyces sp. MMG1533 TaxID=1415546 RepID=UPI0006ADE9C8|nr:hypothetical protein [Streptomyces sp. MMG1533]KOU74304.1 hypothetical protein ADK57_07090 [Streptomyces sp. MMG1533]